MAITSKFRFHVARRMRNYCQDTIMQACWRMRASQLARRFDRTSQPQIYGTLLQNPYAEAILRDFHWHEYMRANPDLHFENEGAARWHFVFNGYAEQRLIDLDRCVGLDTDFYRKRYPRLNLENGAAAQLHYCYMGFYEDLFANADTEWLFNTSLHIFQPGKVGSHAIAAALNGNYEGGVLHLHWPTDLALHYPTCSLTYPKIVAHQRSRPLRVISAGREIVSRALSGVFQYLSTVPMDASGHVDLDRARAHLEKSFLPDCGVVADWFDHQFYCGLDIYAHKFDHEKGYIRIGNSTVDLFLYRLENLSGIEAAMGAFLEMPKFKLSRVNTAEGKSYSAAYDDLMASYIVPRPILEVLYATRYMQFFFSDKERAEFMEYWSKPRRQ